MEADPEQASRFAFVLRDIADPAVVGSLVAEVDAVLNVAACHVTFGLDVVTTRGSNTYGPTRAPRCRARGRLRGLPPDGAAVLVVVMAHQEARNPAHRTGFHVQITGADTRI